MVLTFLYGGAPTSRRNIESSFGFLDFSTFKTFPSTVCSGYMPVLQRHVIDIARATKVVQIAFCVLFLVPESDAYPLLE